MPAPPPAPPAARRRVRWGAVAGLVLFAYAAWAAVDLVLAGVARSAFNRLHELYASFLGRTVIAVVVVAALFHLLDGLRRLAEEARPAWARRDPALRTAVAFATAALGVPAVAVVLWPTVQGWVA